MSKIKIGYPDKWKDYSALVIKSPEEGGTYFENTKNMAKWRYEEDLADLNKPVDKTRWGMSPQTVNAYYTHHIMIVFPAAILQPPFYNYQADEAVNYGGIEGLSGMKFSWFRRFRITIQCRRKFSRLWTAEDSKQFSALTTAFATQYSALEPLPGTLLMVNLGENIGDLGGINAAYDGLQLYLKKMETRLN
jgi:endothelin-converting enzyme/putative endopeptidase